MFVSRQLRQQVLKTAVAGFVFFAVSSAVAKDERFETALDGYCVVSYQTVGDAVKGDRAQKAAFRGFMYYFADEDAKRAFELGPLRYVPQLGGLCTTALGGPYGNSFAGDPTVFSVYADKLYLFSSERAKRAYDLKPGYYIARAEELYKRPELQGFCPASYQLVGKAVPGEERLKQIFRGKVYHFANGETQAAFLKDGARYIPKYNGLCAEGTGRLKRYPGAPSVFSVHEGRTYFFFDKEAKGKFDADPSGMIKKAEANWPQVKKMKKP